jgi:hypothetical protein
MRRQIQSLAQYSLVIQHISGVSNSIADFLSRNPFKKQFRETGTQCNLLPEKDTKMITRQIKKDHTSRKKHSNDHTNQDHHPVGCELQIAHPGRSPVNSTIIPDPSAGVRSMISRISKIVDEKNRIKDMSRAATRVKSKNSHTAQNHCSDNKQRAVVIKTSSETERLIPTGFFNPGLYKDCEVKTITIAQDDQCLCDLIGCSDKVDRVSVKTVQQNPVTPADDTMIPNLHPTISSIAVIEKAQDSDAVLKTVKQWLLSGAKPQSIQAFRAPKQLLSYWKQYSLLSLKDGLIMRKWIPLNNGEKEQECHLICVPENNCEAVMKMCHASLMANHPGIKLTLDICRRYYYWPGMTNDVELFVKACITCGRVKAPQAYSKAKRQHIIAHKFNDVLVIDYVEPEKIGITASGNKYILSMTDMWSGYVVAAATN